MTDLLTITSTFTITTVDAWKIPSSDIKYPIMYPFGYTSYMSSMYLTVLLTFVRYLAVCRKKSFTIKQTIISMESIFLLVIIYNLPKWMFFKWDTVGVGELETTKLPCDPTFYKVYSAGGNGLFLFILPTLMLIISNVLMYKEVLIVNIFMSSLPVLTKILRISMLKISRDQQIYREWNKTNSDFSYL